MVDVITYLRATPHESQIYAVKLLYPVPRRETSVMKPNPYITKTQTVCSQANLSKNIINVY